MTPEEWDKFQDEHFAKAVTSYVREIAQREMRKEKDEFREEVNKSITYIVEQTNKLNKIARKLDMYITSGLELKKNERSS